MRGVLKPRGAHGYVQEIEQAWDGIADWMI